MAKFSAEFQRMWSQSDGTLNMIEFDRHSNEFRKKHEVHCQVQWVLAILFFVIGLLCAIDKSAGGAALFLGLAIYCNMNLTNYSLVAELLMSNRLLAMLVNQQAKEFAVIRKEVTVKPRWPVV